MQRSRLRHAICSSAAVLAAAGGIGAAITATTTSGGEAGTLTASFAKDSEASGGYQGRYTIENSSGTAVEGWKLVFGLPSTAEVTRYWNATITGSGDATTATNAAWNGIVPAGSTVSFGFIVTGSGDPAGCTINGVSCTAAS